MYAQQPSNNPYQAGVAFAGQNAAARLVQETVMRIKDLDVRLEVLSQDLAQLCDAVGNPQAAQLARTPRQLLSSQIGTGQIAQTGQGIAPNVTAGASPFIAAQGNWPAQASAFAPNPYAVQQASAFAPNPYAVQQAGPGALPGAWATQVPHAAAIQAPLGQVGAIDPYAAGNPFATTGAFAGASPFATTNPFAVGNPYAAVNLHATPNPFAVGNPYAGVVAPMFQQAAMVDPSRARPGAHTAPWNAPQDIRASVGLQGYAAVPSAPLPPAPFTGGLIR